MTDKTVSEFATQDESKARIAEVHGLLKEWARWLARDRRAARQTLGYGRNILARVMDGMPRTTCPTCRGGKRVPLLVVGPYGRRIELVDCPNCAAQGWVSGRSSPKKINPAHILPTSMPSIIVTELDEKMSAVAREVQGLDRKLRKAINAEYLWWPFDLQVDKAKRLGYSKNHFNKLIETAQKRIAKGMFGGDRRENIP